MIVFSDFQLTFPHFFYRFFDGVVAPLKRRCHPSDLAATADMTTGNDAAMHHDLETGVEDSEWTGEPGFSDPFDITTTKNASHDSLKRWRVRCGICLFMRF